MKIHNMEQGSPEWFAIKLGVPTASNASKLVTSQGAKSKSLTPYAQKLAGDMYAGKDIDAWEGNIYTQRGHEIEEEARLAYAMRLGSVDAVGFITSGHVGCSPDGLVGDSGMLEIKCLPKKHISALLYFKKNGRAPVDYIPQCQMQMMVAERRWCDLFYYHPDLPSIVIRQFPDNRITDPLQEGIDSCIAERDRILKVLEAM